MLLVFISIIVSQSNVIIYVNHLTNLITMFHDNHSILTKIINVKNNLFPFYPFGLFYLRNHECAGREPYAKTSTILIAISF